MTGTTPEMSRLELAPQRAMFAMEFLDPIRGALVAEGLRVTAEGLRAPTVTPSNRFVWLDRSPPADPSAVPPADRRVRVEAVCARGMFAPFDEMIRVPAYRVGIGADQLRFRRRLRPTGLYDPPAGVTGVGGMLVEDKDSRTPVVGARIRILFLYAEGMELFTGGYTAFTDRRGGFIAALRRIGDVRPDPDPAAPGTFLAWLRLKRGAQVRAFGPLSLRPGRLTRLEALLDWAKLPSPEAVIEASSCNRKSVFAGDEL
ncbi:MAG TPA: hypothetical protein VF574_18825 [Allosphingosinicella sp.]|jgi:hypothetical protein